MLVFSLLRRRNVALLWVGGLTSSVGSSMLFIALPFYVYARTHSALATGAMFIAEMAPAVLLGSVAGVFVDRWDRRRAMIAADLARAALLLLLLAVDTRDRLWIIYAVAAVESALTQFFTPAAGALLPRLVEGRALVAANSLNALSVNLTRLVAPSLGGAVLGLLGLPSVVLADSASYVVSGLLVALIRPPQDATAPASRAAHAHPEATAAWARAWREWRDGLGVIRRDRVLATLFLVRAASAVAQGIFIVLLVPFVKDVLLGGAVVLGWLVTAQGMGGLVGGLVGGRVSRAVAPGRIVGVALLVVGASSLVTFTLPVLPLTLPVLPLTLAAFVLGGTAIVVMGTNQQALLQSRVDDRYLGRVLGAIGTTGALLTLLGTGAASAVGGRLGAVAGLDLACGFWLIAGVLAVALLPGDAGLPACEPAVSPLRVPDRVVPTPEADST